MAKKIRWSAKAHFDRLDILAYWANRNKSITYSVKLDSLIRQCIQLIAELPEIGKPTTLPNVKLKVLRDYFIVYRVNGDYLEVITIWDTRRNPENLGEILKKI